jgi:Cu/Ag efflux pump CusA
VIALWIDWCARNRFLVFTGTLGLVLAGIWAISRIPLDALPDISDVQVIVHTPWNGQPPNIIEDQVTYPIVTSLRVRRPESGVVSPEVFQMRDILWRNAPALGHNIGHNINVA